VVSTVTTSTSLITSSVVSTFNSFTTSTQTFVTTSTSSVSGGGIPGFPVESIIAGIVFGLLTLTVLRRRRARTHAT
jgi:hypothetical protein